MMQGFATTSPTGRRAPSCSLALARSTPPQAHTSGLSVWSAIPPCGDSCSSGPRYLDQLLHRLEAERLAAKRGFDHQAGNGFHQDEDTVAVSSALGSATLQSHSRRICRELE